MRNMEYGVQTRSSQLIAKKPSQPLHHLAVQVVQRAVVMQQSLVWIPNLINHKCIPVCPSGTGRKSRRSSVTVKESST
jgi:hypothetical protein